MSYHADINNSLTLTLLYQSVIIIQYRIYQKNIKFQFAEMSF